MAKVKATFELEINQAREDLRELGVDFKTIEKTINKLTTTTKKQLQAQAGSYERVRGQLKLNTIALDNLTKEERENSNVVNKLLAQRKTYLIQLEKQAEVNRKLKKEIKEIVKAENADNTAKNKNIRSIKELREVTNALVFQRDRLDKTTKDGAKRFETLTKQINKNTNLYRYKMLING